MAVLKTGNTRLWTIERGARPDRRSVYQGYARVSRLVKQFGAVTPLVEADEALYDLRRLRGVSRDTEGMTEVGLDFLAQRDALSVMELARLGTVDLLVHAGSCVSPNDPEGWFDGKILVVRNAMASSMSMANVGTFDASIAVLEGTSFMGAATYEIMPLFDHSDVTLQNAAITNIAKSRYSGCDDCVYRRVLVAVDNNPVSPFIYSTNDGRLWSGNQMWVGDVVLSAIATPNSVSILEPYVVVFTTDGFAGHYWIMLDDVIVASTTMTLVTDGYVEDCGPNAGWARSDTQTLYIAGDGGYVYECTDPEDSVTPIHEGALTSERLTAIHGVGETIVAVGENNTIIASRNAGKTWRLVVGPAIGEDLTTVYCLTENLWWVGASDGNIYFTLDGKSTVSVGFTEKPLPGSASGSIGSIQFFDDLVGYVTRNTTVGSIYRTVDGGYSWHAIPETGVEHQQVDQWSTLAVIDPNFVAVAGDTGGAGRFGLFASNPIPTA